LKKGADCPDWQKSEPLFLVFHAAANAHFVHLLEGWICSIDMRQNRKLSVIAGDFPSVFVTQAKFCETVLVVQESLCGRLVLCCPWDFVILRFVRRHHCNID
jgi:hypothetical protein